MAGRGLRKIGDKHGNETTWGGASASPIVKAVLDNIGRRYLVEHTEADDGSWWADRYSDGWVVQGGYVPVGVGVRVSVTLPIGMQDEKYVLNITTVANGDTDNYETGYGNKTTTSFVLQMPFSNVSNNNASWLAQGYAA